MALGPPLLQLVQAFFSPHCWRPEYCYFVLQENDLEEICCESFTFPHLRNFKLILDREEAWFKRQIHEKYEFV